MAMIAITTKSSINVNIFADGLRLPSVIAVLLCVGKYKKNTVF
jgi:hypothetical protein